MYINKIENRITFNNMVIYFHQKSQKNFFRDSNLSGVKLTLVFPPHQKKRKKRIETIKY